MTINGLVHSWDRYRHRGIVELDDRRTVQIRASDLGAARRLPEWQGPFRLRSGDRGEFIVNDAGDITDVLRVW